MSHSPGAPTRLLVAVAHPDDETFGCGGLLLHAAAAGTDTYVVCATRGEAGEGGTGDEPLGVVRERELHRAAAVLGVREVTLLAHRDSGMSGEPQPRARSAGSGRSQVRVSTGRPARLWISAKTVPTAPSPRWVGSTSASRQDSATDSLRSFPMTGSLPGRPAGRR